MNGHPVVECISIYNTFLSGHVIIHCKKHPQQCVLFSTQLSGMNLLSIQVKSNKKMPTVSHSWYTSTDIQNYTSLKQKVTLGQTGILFTLRVKPRPGCLSIELKIARPTLTGKNEVKIIIFIIAIITIKYYSSVWCQYSFVCAHLICCALFILLHILLFIYLFLPICMLLCCVTFI